MWLDYMKDFRKESNVTMLTFFILRHLHSPFRLRGRCEKKKKAQLFFFHEDNLTPMLTFSSNIGYLNSTNIDHSVVKG